CNLQDHPTRCPARFSSSTTWCRRRHRRSWSARRKMLLTTNWPNSEPEHGQRQHDEGEDRSILTADFSTNQRTRACALHFLIKLIFDHVVKRVRCRSTHPSAENG